MTGHDRDGTPLWKHFQDPESMIAWHRHGGDIMITDMGGGIMGDHILRDCHITSSDIMASDMHASEWDGCFPQGHYASWINQGGTILAGIPKNMHKRCLMASVLSVSRKPECSGVIVTKTLLNILGYQGCAIPKALKSMAFATPIGKALATAMIPCIQDPIHMATWIHVIDAYATATS
jgi:hypothetical protein